jgi:hypothetical protein
VTLSHPVGAETSFILVADVAPIEVRVPRDSAGSFEPQIVKKRQRRLAGVDEMRPPRSKECVPSSNASSPPA